MGFISWLKGDTAEVAEHHDSSLASLIVSTQLQQLSLANSESLSVAAIFRARQILADTLSALPLKSGETLVPAPNALQTVQDLVAETVLSMEDSGDFYWRITQDGFKVLPHERMLVTWNDAKAINRRRVYKFENQIMRTTGIGRNLIVGSVNRTANDLTGMGWMESGAIQSAIAIDKYITEYFAANAMPAGLLSVPREMTPDEAKLLKQQWATNHATRSLGIKPTSWDYDAMSFSPNDSQWVESHLASIGDISNLSGVPAFLLAYSPPGSTQQYENVETILIRLYRETVNPTYAKRIEQGWQEATGLLVKFDPQEIFLTSITNRASAAAQLVGAGYDPDDVTETVGLPAMGTVEQENNVPTN